MAEPDFEQIAKACLAAQGVYEDFLGETAIVAALRQVWNARGAADIEAVEYETETIIAPDGVSMTDLQQHLSPAEAIKALDR